jgi:hypothetical protein
MSWKMETRTMKKGNTAMQKKVNHSRQQAEEAEAVVTMQVCDEDGFYLRHLHGGTLLERCEDGVRKV